MKSGEETCTAAAVRDELTPDQLREQLRLAMAAMDVEAYEVGGCIRDELNGLPIKDIDLAVCGVSLDDLRARAKKHGYRTSLNEIDFDRKATRKARVKGEDTEHEKQVVGVRLYAPWTPEEGVEISLARGEVSTGVGRHEFEIKADPSVTIEQDLWRRDFTINAIARNLETGEIIDPTGGVQDVKDGILRMVHPDTFKDDRLRVLRAFARVAKEGLEIDPITWQALKTWGRELEDVSAERARDEIFKILAGRHAAKALGLARDCGALETVIPAFQPTIGFRQESKYHEMTCDEHILAVVDEACRIDAPIDVRLAALFHDAWKPQSAWTYPEWMQKPVADGGKGKDDRRHYFTVELKDDAGNKVTYPGHEEVGAEEIRAALDERGLRMDNRRVALISYLIRHHMYQDDATIKPRADGTFREKDERRARRFIAEHGRERAQMLVQLRWCDRTGKGTADQSWREHQKAWQRLVASQMTQPSNVKELATSPEGKAIGQYVTEIGIPFWLRGEIVSDITRRVIDDPEFNNWERIEQWADQAKHNIPASEWQRVEDLAREEREERERKRRNKEMAAQQRAVAEERRAARAAAAAENESAA